MNHLPLNHTFSTKLRTNFASLVVFNTYGIQSRLLYNSTECAFFFFFPPYPYIFKTEVSMKRLHNLWPTSGKVFLHLSLTFVCNNRVLSSVAVGIFCYCWLQYSQSSKSCQKQCNKAASFHGGHAVLHSTHF